MTTKAEADVLAERAKQRAKWGDSHDDEEHENEELAGTAALLADPNHSVDPLPRWARPLLTKHASDRRQQLVIAAALAIAEIERLDRWDAEVKAMAEGTRKARGETP